MKQQNKISTGRHQEQSAETQAQSSKTGPLEFQNAEELLRHDAAQTDVPPEIARRLSKSISQSPAPRRPWWRKWLGKSE